MRIYKTEPSKHGPLVQLTKDGWRDLSGVLMLGAADYCLISREDGNEEWSPGEWLTEDGQRVRVVSIHGTGEIRWSLQPYSNCGDDRMKQVITHFKLKPVEPTHPYRDMFGDPLK